jgi:hypothetical protein
MEEGPAGPAQGRLQGTQTEGKRWVEGEVGSNSEPND